MMQRFIILLLTGMLFTGYAYSEEISVRMHFVTPEGIGKEIGTVALADSPYGLILTPRLSGLPSGIHGFHVHENPNCSPAKEGERNVPALAAGGHFDPEKTGRHEGPFGKGHLGDLPALYADKDGNVNIPVLAPRLKVSDVKSHSLMIHAGGDNYSDHPERLGGGGSRIVCGIVLQ